MERLALMAFLKLIKATAKTRTRIYISTLRCVRLAGSSIATYSYFSELTETQAVECTVVRRPQLGNGFEV